MSDKHFYVSCHLNLVQYNYNSQNPSNGHFDGNTVKALLSARLLRLGGLNSTCNNNNITGSASSDYNISIQGTNVTAVGNNIVITS